MSVIKRLNLGCGRKFHSSWTNIDFDGDGKNVICHNLLKGIPFKDNDFDVVYHSHLLEHFSKDDASSFLKECLRVLKPEGIIRIAVPDLEQIINHYKINLENALQNKLGAESNYDWIMLELYDQTVRNSSGGNMKKYILEPAVPNWNYIYQRLGNEAKQIRVNKDAEELTNNFKILKYFKFKNWYNFFVKIILTKVDYHHLQIGKFRNAGEIHQWMYDQYSLKNLLKKTGFNQIAIKTAIESDITNWNDYILDADANGNTHKPDSLFIEARK